MWWNLFLNEEMANAMMFLLRSEHMPLKYNSCGESKSKSDHSGKSWELKKKNWIKEFVNIVKVNFLIILLGNKLSSPTC